MIARVICRRRTGRLCSGFAPCQCLREEQAAERDEHQNEREGSGGRDDATLAFPLDRLTKGVKRRTTIVGVFPNDAAVIRLVSMILAEQHDKWQVSRCYFIPESLATATHTEPRRERLPLLAVG